MDTIRFLVTDGGRLGKVTGTFHVRHDFFARDMEQECQVGFFPGNECVRFLEPISLSLSPSFFLFGLFLLLFLMSVIDSFANFFYRETDVYMVLPFKRIRLLSKYICNILLKLLFEDQCVVSKLMFSV